MVEEKSEGDGVVGTLGNGLRPKSPECLKVLTDE
jgi:hypothetical protein